MARKVVHGDLSHAETWVKAVLSNGDGMGIDSCAHLDYAYARDSHVLFGQAVCRVHECISAAIGEANALDLLDLKW